MTLAWFFERLQGFSEAPAVSVHDQTVSYRELLALVSTAEQALRQGGVTGGQVAALHGDFSHASVAAVLALANVGAITVPITSAARHQATEFQAIADVQVNLRFEPGATLVHASADGQGQNALYDELRARHAPGLVLFTSGSTGVSKGVVHDLARFFEKFRRRRHAKTTLAFLLFDHVGGLNTLFHTLSNGGHFVVPNDHQPDTVARAIERYKVQLLPTSPTFLNLLLLSGAIDRFDLSSLSLITYGTEPMPQSTLARVAFAFPRAKLQQTYGLSELGVLRSRSDDNTSLWVRLGGEGFETSVRDGILYVRAHSAMLGYLNAPSPFDADGWLCTGDEVEQDGDRFLIKGRRVETINVGGQKVFPAEVESVVAELGNVADATVFGEKHPILGQTVVCKVNLIAPEDPAAFRSRLRKHCLQKMASFKVPVRVEITNDVQYNARHKRVRQS